MKKPTKQIEELLKSFRENNSYNDLALNTIIQYIAELEETSVPFEVLRAVCYVRIDDRCTSVCGDCRIFDEIIRENK
jgi:hypothetical protein